MNIEIKKDKECAVKMTAGKGFDFEQQKQV